MLIIVGLGNIGKKYEKTYHNAGFCVVDNIAQIFNPGEFKEEKNFLISSFFYNRQKVVLVKPTTYMNESGIAVNEILLRYKCAPQENFIVVYDDVEIKPGSVRIRDKGTAGSHNGMKSLIKHLGTNDFKRVRVSIGPKPEYISLEDYVLSSAAKNKDFAESVNKATEAVVSFIKTGDIKDAMQKYSS